jgi:hypothetical protein
MAKKYQTHGVTWDLNQQLHKDIMGRIPLHHQRHTAAKIDSKSAAGQELRYKYSIEWEPNFGHNKDVFWSGPEPYGS